MKLSELHAQRGPCIGNRRRLFQPGVTYENPIGRRTDRVHMNCRSNSAAN
jgi:hypothetical protein